jgi:hypothetical protein
MQLDVQLSSNEKWVPGKMCRRSQLLSAYKEQPVLNYAEWRSQ